MPGEADRRLDAAAESYLDAIARELASADLPERQRGELLANVRELLTAGASPAAVGAAEDVVSAYAEAADGADGARDPGGSGVWDPASGRLLAPKPRGGGSNLAWGGIAARLGLLRPDDVDEDVLAAIPDSTMAVVRWLRRSLARGGGGDPAAADPRPPAGLPGRPDQVERVARVGRRPDRRPRGRPRVRLRRPRRGPDDSAHAQRQDRLPQRGDTGQRPAGLHAEGRARQAVGLPRADGRLRLRRRRGPPPGDEGRAPTGRSLRRRRFGRGRVEPGRRPAVNAAVIVARPWSDLSPQIKAFMLVAVACQLLLAVVALVVWWRTPADLMPSPGRAVWAAVIVMVQIGGPILFLALRAAAARRAREAVAEPPGGDPGRAEMLSGTVDALYGDGEPR